MSEGDQSNGSLGGRPTSLEKLGIRKEDIWNLALEGLTNPEIARRLSRSKGKISVRTVNSYRAQMPEGYKALFDDFDKLPQIPELHNWLKSRYDDPANAEPQLAMIRNVWEQVWKKPLESVTEQDLLRAIAWIKENHAKSQFHWLLALRTICRVGIFPVEWLTKHLSTKGKKGAYRIPAILTKPEFFKTILPKMLAESHSLEGLTKREKDEFALAFAIKVTTGIRTGERKKERELWGTKIKQGQTSLQITDGKLMDWEVFAKKKEVWKITLLPVDILKELVNHVGKYELKPGDFLIQELTTPKALKALRQLCKKVGIESLRLHDLRKVYLTGLCLAGVPLETAVTINVGWKDLNTARDHYQMIKGLNADKEYSKFSKKWFA